MKHLLKKWSLLFLVLCLIGALIGCGQKTVEAEQNLEQEAPAEAEAPAEPEVPSEAIAPAEPEVPSEAIAPAEPEVPSEAIAPAEPEVPSEAAAPVEAEAPALWVGTVQGGFTTYPIAAEGELTPDQLIGELAALTGWNLDLAEPVTTGKGGMSVVFTKDCALVTGPPSEQKEEFMVLDNYSLANWVLDSIEATLQHYFVLPPGDPSVLDIYFNVEMEPIVVEDRTLPIDQPWDSGSFFS